METSALSHQVEQSPPGCEAFCETFVVTVTVPAGNQKQVQKTETGSCRFELMLPSYLSNRIAPGFGHGAPLNRISQLQAVLFVRTLKLSVHATLIPVEAYLFVIANVRPAKTPLSVWSLL